MISNDINLWSSDVHVWLVALEGPDYNQYIGLTFDLQLRVMTGLFQNGCHHFFIWVIQYQ